MQKWGLIANYPDDNFSLTFGVDVYAPNTITTWDGVKHMASLLNYPALWWDGDIQSTSSGYSFSTKAQKIIAADATDYASYWTSNTLKNGTIVTTPQYKRTFQNYFLKRTTQYLLGTTMNILNGNEDGTTVAKLTDGDPNNCN